MSSGRWAAEYPGQPIREGGSIADGLNNVVETGNGRATGVFSLAVLGCRGSGHAGIAALCIQHGWYLSVMHPGFTSPH